VAKNKIAFKVGGPAGAGIMTISSMFAKCLQRSCLNVVTENEYPSLIKGGHNASYVRAEEDAIFSHMKPIDILIALDRLTIEKHYEELTEGGVIIYDNDKIKLNPKDVKRPDIKLCHVPLNRIAEETGSRIFFNNVALGATMALLNMDFTVFNNVINQRFSKKGDDVVNKNIEAAKKGGAYLREHYKEPFKHQIEKVKRKEKTLQMTGNDAVCAGAIKAGVKYVGEYPMTPSSSVLHFMAAHERKYNIVVKHTEDELAAINSIIGASYAGARSLTATSGGGFSLMVEALGMAGMSETPIVIIESQRGGPSTGLPTQTEQSDLRFALHASQGEFPRIVMAPGDLNECFYETINVFNMAEKCQVPAIILLDKHISSSSYTVNRFDLSRIRIERGKYMTDEQMKKAKNFLRYRITDDGVSARCFPGQKNGMHVASSYEHDETGFTSEEPLMRINQNDKRFRKLNNISEDDIAPAFYGDDEADVSIVAWGSTKGAVLEAMKHLRKDGVKVNFMHLFYISPFPKNKVKEFLEKAKKTLLIEANKTAQLGAVIKEHACIEIENKYLKYDCRPFFPEDIYQKVRELV